MEHVELKSEALFPKDVHAVEETREDEPVTRRVTAHDFAAGNGRYSFGVSPVQTASSLRLLADRIEAKQILPQRAQVTSEADRADYTRSVLILEFCERVR